MKYTMPETFNAYNKDGSNNRSVITDTDSTYLRLDDFIDQSQSHEDRLACLLALSDGPLTRLYEEAAAAFMKKYKTMKPLVMDRETISVDGIAVKAKKMYAVTVDYQETTRHDPPELKVTGLGAKKAIMGNDVRSWLKEFYVMLIKGESQESFNAFAKAKFELYKKLPLSEVCNNISMNTYNKPGAKSPAIDGAKYFNKIAEKEGIGIRVTNEKVMQFFIIPSAATEYNETISVTSDKQALEILERFADHIDYKRQFEHQFIADAEMMAAIRRMTISIKDQALDWLV